MLISFRHLLMTHAALLYPACSSTFISALPHLSPHLLLQAEVRRFLQFYDQKYPWLREAKAATAAQALLASRRIYHTTTGLAVEANLYCVMGCSAHHYCIIARHLF